MYSIKTVTVEQIAELGYKPDPHTVSLKDRGTWYALTMDGEVLSLLCIRVQRGELYIGEVYTPPKHRKKGYFTILLKNIIDRKYNGYSIVTHALKTSRDGFIGAGFKEFAFRHFKHGDQWWLRRSGKKYDSKPICDQEGRRNI